ncbi:hypothetical protein GCM10011492_30030 [Flexivirga endophytica]|uniref:N-acetyltransferase domain-containing protein n=1 Tax=Flexivirga endophytica TaxID=1849103 RepID=A0A916WVH5_9MICO|nr:hypothetical protein GCM10011492_30030 [Flexivirga endophytica]GHB44845.1 hypothetical protein GCM10008112_12420 [Flexivirga endophytica]
MPSLVATAAGRATASSVKVLPKTAASVLPRGRVKGVGRHREPVTCDALTCEASGVTDELDGIRIERAVPEDAFVLAAMTLRWDLEGGSPRRAGFIDEFAEAWLAQGNARPAWLARRADGDPVGFAIGILATSLPSLRRPTGGWLHLSSVYVVPELRGSGLGERMLRQVIDWAADGGLYRVQLNATDRARSLYRRVGFGGPQDTLMQCVLTDRLPTS